MNDITISFFPFPLQENAFKTEEGDEVQWKGTGCFSQ